MPRTLLRVALVSGLLLTVGLLGAGCGSSVDNAAAKPDVSAAPGKHGGMVTIGMEQEPQCLNVWIACGGMAVTNDITTPLYDGLIEVGHGEQWHAKMATRIPTTDNGDVVDTPDGGMDVKITIRPEARWSDGRPITCDDIKFTLKTMMDPRWTVTSRTGYDLVKSIDCVGQRTAIYHFKQPYALYLGIVGGAPLPEHALAGKDFNTYLNSQAPVTSGPYLFDHWTRSVEIVFRRNPHYWNAGPNQQPYLDKLRFAFVASTETLKIQLRTGEVDMINPPPDTTLTEEMSHTPRIKFQTMPAATWEHISFNARAWPTSDLAVRRAISWSIDRKQIADVVLKKQAKVIDSPLLPEQKEYYKPSFAPYHLDNAKARKILEADGWKRTGQYYTKNGKPLLVTLKSTAGNDLRQKVGQLMQQSLAKSGIKVELSFINASVFFSQTTLQGDFDMAIWGTGATQPDPNQRTSFACDQIPTKANQYSGQNNYFWCNDEATDILKKIDVTPDIAERGKLYGRLQDILADQVPVLPLFQWPGMVAYNEHLHGVDINPIGGRTWNTADWWKDGGAS